MKVRGWLFAAFILGAATGGATEFAFHTPQTVQEAWQEGYESGYADGTGEAYEPLPLFPIFALVGGVAVVFVIVGIAYRIAKKQEAQP